jgi:hypothetical protein
VISDPFSGARANAADSRYHARPSGCGRLNIDYHVAFDGNFYSVSYNLVHEQVEVRATITTIEILHKGTRVASHVRSRGHDKAITLAEHRPKSHQAHLEWPPSRLIDWARKMARTRRN